jgi:hypothetical protein
MELGACHPSSDKNMEMAPRYWENLWISYVGSNNTSGNVCINVVLRRVRANVVEVAKQYYIY